MHPRFGGLLKDADEMADRRRQPHLSGSPNQARLSPGFRSSSCAVDRLGEDSNYILRKPLRVMRDRIDQLVGSDKEMLVRPLGLGELPADRFEFTPADRRLLGQQAGAFGNGGLRVLGKRRELRQPTAMTLQERDVRFGKHIREHVQILVLHPLARRTQPLEFADQPLDRRVALSNRLEHFELAERGRIPVAIDRFDRQWHH